METQPTQSQMFNINNVSSPKDSTSGQCGSGNFMHMQKGGNHCTEESFVLSESTCSSVHGLKSVHKYRAFRDM